MKGDDEADWVAKHQMKLNMRKLFRQVALTRSTVADSVGGLGRWTRSADSVALTRSADSVALTRSSDSVV
jgi:hypothetical protein